MTSDWIERSEQGAGTELNLFSNPWTVYLRTVHCALSAGHEEVFMRHWCTALSSSSSGDRGHGADTEAEISEDLEIRVFNGKCN